MSIFSSSSRMPVGWYPDPQGAGGYRWWDGSAWTPLVVDRPPDLAA